MPRNVSWGTTNKEVGRNQITRGLEVQPKNFDFCLGPRSSRPLFNQLYQIHWHTLSPPKPSICSHLGSSSLSELGQVALHLAHPLSYSQVSALFCSIPPLPQLPLLERVPPYVCNSGTTSRRVSQRLIQVKVPSVSEGLGVTGTGPYIGIAG